MYIYIYIYTYFIHSRQRNPWEPPRKRETGGASENPERKPQIGANYCTPEINTSEIIVDFQWHFPMDVQRCFPVEFHMCDFWNFTCMFLP